MKQIENKEEMLAKLDARKKSAIKEVEDYFKALENAVRTGDEKELEFADGDWIKAIFENSMNLLK